MDVAVRELVRALHAAPVHYALAATGGGTGAAAWLLAVPGGSRCVLEVAVPYAESALIAYLGSRPVSFCSPATARLMAARALERARTLAPRTALAGVGCTASLRSDRPKRGDHRFHLAVDTGLSVTTHSLTLTKEAREREGEEDLLDRVLLNALSAAFGIATRLDLPLLPGEALQTETTSHTDALSAFLDGRGECVCVEPDGRVHPDGPRPTLLLPGSFNPLHEGHLRLAAVAARKTDRPAAFELTVCNADKPPLEAEEVRWRAAQFAWRAPLWLTRAATFAKKAALFPGTVFVVGTDTAARIVQPRFYGDDPAVMRNALAALGQAGCRFLVAGRVDAEGRFLGLEHLEIPADHRPLFEGISGSEFRFDLSSTQLRSGGAGG
jgi:hypothetical protein